MRKWTSAAVLVGLAVVALGGQGTTVHRGDVRIDGTGGVELTDEQGITITAPAVGERTLRRYLRPLAIGWVPGSRTSRPTS